MKYLLDTNICIYLIKKKPVGILTRLQSYTPLDIGISVITLAELRYGVKKSQFPEKNGQALQEFLIPFQILPFNEEAAFIYGDIRADLEKKGKTIGSLDMMIGAHALSLETTLVTNNVREFSRIPSLQVENWVK